jgi:hypothetical protein
VERSQREEAAKLAKSINTLFTLIILGGLAVFRRSPPDRKVVDNLCEAVAALMVKYGVTKGVATEWITLIASGTTLAVQIATGRTLTKDEVREQYGDIFPVLKNAPKEKAVDAPRTPAAPAAPEATA